MARLASRQKRRELRLPVRLSGRDAEGLEFQAQGRSIDVSGAGMRIETRHVLDVGARLLLEMPVPAALRGRFGERELYRVQCVVRRVEVPEDGALYRVGVQFTGEPDAPPD